MAAEAISRFGRPAQKRKYLPRISAGDILSAAFALTEKEAGSDAGAITTRALSDPGDPDTFILDGAKTFITSGDASGVLIVIARTDVTAPKPEFSALLVEPSTDGFSVTDKMDKMGQRSSSTVSLKFDRCRVHKDQLLGRRGQGLKIALGTLDAGRIGVAAQSVGIAEAAYEAAAAYAMERRQFGKPIAHLQAVQHKLADMLADLEAARLLTLRAAWLKDKRRPYLKEASLAKLYAAEACNRIAAAAVQIHGGAGYSRERLVEKYYRDARVTTIYEGTSEIQRLIIGREIAKERQTGEGKGSQA
jgi:alkylation response protein AidB-like acyl-CoA dehydrogenase